MLSSARTVKWVEVGPIGYPASCVEIEYKDYRTIWVRVFFTEGKDLLLTFEGAKSAILDDDMDGQFHHLYPDPLPVIDDAASPRMTYPLLRVEGSKWLAGLIDGKGREHFVIITSEDIFQVLAMRDVKAEWVGPRPG